MSTPIPSDWREQAASALTRGSRLDRHIPAFFRHPLVRALGFAYGCTIGWSWGFLLSRGAVERHGELFVFRGLPPWAFPRGGVCVGHCFLTGDGALDERVLRHEEAHVAQWRRYGALMPLLYLLAGRNPLRNRFEIEAGLQDGGYVPRDL